MAGHHHDGEIGLDRTPPDPATRHAGARSQKGIRVAGGSALRFWNVLDLLGCRGGAQQQRQRQPPEAKMCGQPLLMTAVVPGHASDQIGDESSEPSLESSSVSASSSSMAINSSR